MKIKTASRPGSDTHIGFVLKGDMKNAIKDFEAEKDTITVRYKGKRTVIYCGLGERTECTSRTIRAAAAAGIKKAAELKRKAVSVLDTPVDCRSDACARAAIEGALLGAYSFSKYKSKKPAAVTGIEFVTKEISSQEANDIFRLCRAAWYTRDLVNDNASVTTPEHLAAEARAIAADKSVSVEILDERAIRKKGLGLLWAVGKGSPYPPRLALMEYKGDPSSKRKIAVVGKGITFDSGGQNLKPSGHIETMRCDMAGAAAVLGLMRALTSLKPKLNVVGVITCAHNAVGSNAYFPGDVYTSYAGTNVEITNTDAEGRLALADAFAYVQKHYRPSHVIDLATLTGSVVMALGDTVAGLFANSDALAQSLYHAGEKTGERLWRLPLYEEHSESMKSDHADLRNTSKLKRGYAGSITAAAFLKEFVGKKVSWAHIDIAGTAFNEGEARGEVPKYGTGFGVRLLWEYLTA
ncbi:MAG: aminopeptidase [Chitinivibrionales bacterium]|nr:aminopeptidase [Chitinivibrionales bacterium]MBD3394833.1 aminopeptidase [Chitinivibrionales bacterium]